MLMLLNSQWFWNQISEAYKNLSQYIARSLKNIFCLLKYMYIFTRWEQNSSYVSPLNWKFKKLFHFTPIFLLKSVFPFSLSSFSNFWENFRSQHAYCCREIPVVGNSPSWFHVLFTPWFHSLKPYKVAATGLGHKRTDNKGKLQSFYGPPFLQGAVSHEI